MVRCCMIKLLLKKPALRDALHDISEFKNIKQKKKTKTKEVAEGL